MATKPQPNDLDEERRAARVNHPTARRMVAAARRILKRDGFQALTLETVSAEAKVNKASTRYYFGGKDGLVEAVVREIVTESLDAGVRPALDSGPADLADAFIERTRRIAVDSDTFAGFFEVLPQVRQSDVIKSEFSDLYQQWFGWNLEWLGIADREMSPSTRRGAGMFIAAVLDGLAVQATIFEPGYDAEDCLRFFRKVLLQVIEGSLLDDTD